MQTNCENCLKEIASIACFDCSDKGDVKRLPLCLACSAIHHAGRWKHHKLEDITKCSHCEENVSTLVCNECNSKYCSECSIVLHKHSSKKGHTILSGSNISSTKTTTLKLTESKSENLVNVIWYYNTVKLPYKY